MAGLALAAPAIADRAPTVHADAGAATMIAAPTFTN